MGIIKIRKESKLGVNNITSKSETQEDPQVLKNSLNYLKAELNKFKELPLLVCDVRKIIGNKAVIRVPNGSHFYVNISGELKIGIGDSVLVEQRSLTIVDKIDSLKSFDVEDFVIVEKPKIGWDHIGGLDEAIEEIREVVELPLLKPQLFKDIGIEPPKGILLYGPPGTGKTLLARAVATSANCTFIEFVGSELVQKFIGEGAKLVRDIFKLARERAPSIVFIDEIDAIASERVDVGTSGEREVQRTFMQLLTEMDGFSSLDGVKVIAATNRFDILDQAILRPGRFDRLIEVPLPTNDSRVDLFKIHSKNMTLHNIEFDKLLEGTEGFSGADIRAVCTEAGYFAIRSNRSKIYHEDFLNAIEKVNGTEMEDVDSASMFG
ncbi:MAG TPA: AAA family ATPase [Candidatus Nanoarchaeia archaeon]|nr:AAA family ATPase [Candidatus Nanoarchaeia archaeon]